MNSSMNLRDVGIQSRVCLTPSAASRDAALKGVFHGVAKTVKVIVEAQHAQNLAKQRQ